MGVHVLHDKDLYILLFCKVLFWLGYICPNYIVSSTMLYCTQLENLWKKKKGGYGKWQQV